MACERFRIIVPFTFLVVLVLISGCNAPGQKYATIKPFTLTVDQKVTESVDRILPLNSLQGAFLENKWLVNTSDHRGGLNVSIPDFTDLKGESLPHRIQLPDHSIWYQAKLDLEKGMLHINADDGAQMWLNGERVRPEWGNYFPIVNSGFQEITIRVINNAMAGGLRSVQLISEEEWASRKDLTRRREILRELITKQELVIDLTETERGLLKSAVANPSTENLSAAKEALKTKPILLAEPILQKSSNGQTYLRWLSSLTGQAYLVWGSNSLDLNRKSELRSEEGIFLAPVDTLAKFYRIIQEGLISPVYQFKENRRPHNQRFMVWADSQSGWSVFDSIMKTANNHRPDFSVGAGDLVNQGDDKLEYLRLLRSLHQGRFTHYPVPGNHDYDGYYEQLKAENYNRFLGLPKQRNYFAWREGDLAFIALDLNESFPIDLPKNSAQYQWFFDQLKSEGWTSAEWRFLVLHHPPYSQGWPGYSGEEAIRKLLEPLYESAKIDVVIAGHTHDYERLIKTFGNQKTAFLVVGGAGGGLEPIENSELPKMDVVKSIHHFGIMDINGKVLSFQAIDLKNQVIDSFDLSH